VAEENWHIGYCSRA